MYNSHRGIGPAPNNRLSELLEQVRAEFENQQNRTGEYEANSKFPLFLTCLLVLLPPISSTFSAVKLSIARYISSWVLVRDEILK